jgi:hypothetical protein
MRKVAAGLFSSIDGGSRRAISGSALIATYRPIR